MKFKIGDCVMLYERIVRKDSESNELLYGKVVSCGVLSDIGVCLSKPLDGKLNYTFPSYFADRISQHWYETKTRIHTYGEKGVNVCYHDWENTGSSPITGEVWINCKRCNIAKEKA